MSYVDGYHECSSATGIKAPGLSGWLDFAKSIPGLQQEANDAVNKAMLEKRMSPEQGTSLLVQITVIMGSGEMAAAAPDASPAEQVTALDSVRTQLESIRDLANNMNQPKGLLQETLDKAGSGLFWILFAGVGIYAWQKGRQ